jgi:hypothetical protein
LAIRRLRHTVIAMFAPVGLARPAGICLLGTAAVRAAQGRLDS